MNNDSEAIQLASIQALINYSGNEYVRSSLRSKLLRADGEVFRASVQVYQQLANTQELISTMNTLQRRDTVGVRTLYLISEADSLHFTEEARSIADEYSGSDYPFEIRKSALNYLENYDTDASSWQDKLATLASDADPRIRFWAAEHAPRFLSSTAAVEFLESAMLNEMDPRVKAMIFAVIEELR